MRMDTVENHARLSAGTAAGASPRTTPRGEDPERGYRVLLVEDSKADALIVEDYLRAECGSRVACACVETMAAARTALEREAFDAILLDLNLPDAQGIDSVVTVIQIAPATPVIVLTATRDNEIGYRAVGLGAEDFVNKQTIDSAALLRTIRHAIERHHLRVALERNLREMEAAHGRSLSLVDGNADAIVVIDWKGVFRFVNPAAERMLNRSAEALRGHVLGVSVDDALPSELKFLGPDGETRVAEIRAMDSVWEGEHSYIATLRDVTERKESERLLRVAKQAAEEANAMKSEFLANMSHELRTPLNAIIGFTQLMLLEPMGPVGNAKYREYLEIINRGGEHLLSLIDDLLDLSRAETGTLTLAESDFALADVIVAAVQLVRAPADTGKVAVAIEEGLPRALVRADPRLLKQVLINLLDNGIKFTPEGGKVSVFALPLPDGGPRIGVRDTGIGLPEEKIPRAFASFMRLDKAYVRGSNQGSGLGLALCKRIMESHGGAIAMTSQVGVGTSVHCDLPSRRVIALRADGR
ncbi:MAG: response regulator [Alphaproteobacteria bacterium]|nr:response regulator [Alphaproteobacteria bacterium]